MALQLDFTVTAISTAVTNARYEIKKDGGTSVATGLIDIPSNGVMSLPMDTVDVLEKDLVSIHLDDFNGSNSVDAQSCFGWTNIIYDDITVTYEAATVTLKNPTYVTGTWDFGDGSATTTTVDPIYDYGKSGTYTIVFTSEGGATYSRTLSLTYILINFYDNGEAGAWYKASDTSTLFQDGAGTTTANSVGEPVGLWVDTSPNALDATQSVSASRPTYSTTPVSNLSFDLVDDELVVPLVSGDYTVFEQSPSGLLEYTITTTTDWIRDSLLGSISEIIIVNGTPDITNIRNYLLDKHGNNRFSGLVDASGLFHGSYGRGEVTSLNANDWDTSGVTDFYTFMAGSPMTTIECANWDTSSATTFSYFAQYCLNLTTIDVSNWNVSRVTNFGSFVTQALMTTLDVSLWDVSSVTNFKRFSASCENLTALDVGSWDVSSVTNFSGFVNGCPSLTTLDVSGWNTLNVTDFASFCSNSYPDRGAISTLDVSNWNVSSVTDFSGFISKSSLQVLDVSSWNTLNVTDFSYFALSSDLLETLGVGNVSNWNVSSVTDFGGFMAECSSLTTLDVSNWDVSNVQEFDRFVSNCSTLGILDVSNWNTLNVTDFSYFVAGCSSLQVLDVSSWNTSSVTDFERLVNNCPLLSTLDVSNWNTLNVTTFTLFTYGCSSLTTITVNGGTGNPFADSGCLDYYRAFTNTNLSQQSIDDILVAINSAGTSNGDARSFQSGGSAPSATGNAAIDGLRSRGWTITVTGGY
jgi:surface protein